MTEKDITTAAELAEYLKESKDVLVVDFHATWCGPCRLIAPTVHEYAQEYGINVARVDVDKAQQLSKQYDITGMPTFKLLAGKIDNYEMTIVGANKSKLEEMFARALEYKK